MVNNEETNKDHAYSTNKIIDDIAETAYYPYPQGDTLQQERDDFLHYNRLMSQSDKDDLIKKWQAMIPPTDWSGDDPDDSKRNEYLKRLHELSFVLVYHHYLNDRKDVVDFTNRKLRTNQRANHTSIARLLDAVGIKPIPEEQISNETVKQIAQQLFHEIPGVNNDNLISHLTSDVFGPSYVRHPFYFHEKRGGPSVPENFTHSALKTWSYLLKLAETDKDIKELELFRQLSPEQKRILITEIARFQLSSSQEKNDAARTEEAEKILEKLNQPATPSLTETQG